MSKNSKNLAIYGGAFIIGASALAYYILKRSPTQSTEVAAQKKCSRETLIAVLNSLKREQFSVILKIQKTVSDIKKTPRVLSAQGLKQLVLDDADIKASLSKISSDVLAKNDISGEDYTYNCQVVYKKDKEIQKLLGALNARIEDAAEGTPVDLSATIPQSLTSSSLLRIHQEISQEIVRQQQEAFKQIKAEVEEFTLKDPVAIKYLNKIDVEAIRNQILSQNSLDSYEESAVQIFNYATEKYQQESSQFKAQLKATEVNLQQNYQEFMEIEKAAKLKSQQAAKQEEEEEDAGGLFD